MVVSADGQRFKHVDLEGIGWKELSATTEIAIRRDYSFSYAFSHTRDTGYVRVWIPIAHPRITLRFIAGYVSAQVHGLPVRLAAAAVVGRCRRG